MGVVGGGLVVDSSSGAVVANKEPLFGGGKCWGMVGVVGVVVRGSSEGSRGGGGRSIGWGHAGSHRGLRDGQDNVVWISLLVLLDKGHEGRCKGGVAVEDCVKEGSRVGGKGGMSISWHGGGHVGDIDHSCVD